MTTPTTHTPGPWTLSGDAITGIDRNGLRGPIATMTHFWRDRRVDRANAHLLAAAPDLLDAARALDAHMMRGGAMHQGHPLHLRLRAAIAQADGRTPQEGTP